MRVKSVAVRTESPSLVGEVFDVCVCDVDVCVCVCDVSSAVFSTHIKVFRSF